MPSIALLPSTDPIGYPRWKDRGLKVKPKSADQIEEMKRKRHLSQSASLPLNRKEIPAKEAITSTLFEQSSGSLAMDSQDVPEFLKWNPDDFERLEGYEVWEIEHRFASLHKVMHGKDFPIDKDGNTIDDLIFGSTEDGSFLPKTPCPQQSIDDKNQPSTGRKQSTDSHQSGIPGFQGSFSFPIESPKAGSPVTTVSDANGGPKKEKTKSGPPNSIGDPYGINPELRNPTGDPYYHKRLARLIFAQKEAESNRPLLSLRIEGDMMRASKEDRKMKPQVSRFYVKKPIDRRIQQTVKSPVSFVD